MPLRDVIHWSFTRRWRTCQLAMSVAAATAVVAGAPAAASPAPSATSPDTATATGVTAVQVTRLPDNPIIRLGSGPGLEENINGPSLIRVPDWVDAPLGRYYLYFAHHKGAWIRLAHAARPEGPYTLHAPGSLALADSLFPTQPPVLTGEQASRASEPYAHIASPDVHVVPERREIRMYYHGLNHDGRQVTRVATSSDGLHFTARPEVLGAPYFRVFRHGGAWYALAMPGQLYRSADGLSGFVPGPRLFNPQMRHSALTVRGSTLHVFWTQVGHAPEHVLHSTIALSGDWTQWRDAGGSEVLRPEQPWEGADLPVAASTRGAILARVNQLRDPALFEDDGNVWLLYSVAGESGIAIARLTGL
jgi:hypothetical protein